MSRAAPVPGEWWCWRCDEPASFRCRERSHDVRQHFATGGIVTAPVMPGGESTSAALRQTQSALAASQAETDRVREVMVWRTNELSAVRERFVNADAERRRLAVEVRAAQHDRNEMYQALYTATWDRDAARAELATARTELEQLRAAACPDPAAHTTTDRSTDV